jgi:hypothetical protein
MIERASIAGVLAVERRLRHRHHLAVDLHRRRKLRGDEEVRAALRDQRAQQVVHELGCLFSFHGASWIAG